MQSLDEIVTAPNERGLAPYANGVLLALLGGLATALVVVADPYLSVLIPSSWWAKIYLDEAPLRLTPILIATAGATLLVVLPAIETARRSPSRRVWVVVLLVGAQTNGIRAGPFDVLDVATLLLLLLILAQSFGSAGRRLEIPGVVWMGLLILILDLPHAIHQNPVRFTLGFVGLLKVILSGFVLFNLIERRRDLRIAVDVLLLVALGSAAVAVIQFALAQFAGIELTLFHHPDQIHKPTSFGTFFRSTALTATPQHVSTFLTLCLPFMLQRMTEVGASRALHLLGALLLAAGIVVTWNFGGILVALGVTALFPWVRWPRRLIHFSLAAAALLAIGYYSGGLDFVYAKTFGDHSVAKGVGQRMTLLHLGFEQLDRNPWFGVGLREMARFSGNFWHRPVHNAYLQSATEISLVAALLFVGLMMVLGTLLFLVGRRRGTGVPGLARASLLSLVGLSVLMMTEPMLDHSNTWLFFILYEIVLIQALRDMPRGIRFPKAMGRSG